MFFYRLVLLGIFAALRQYDIEEWMNIKSISYPPFKCVFVFFTCMAPYLTWVQGSSGNWGIIALSSPLGIKSLYLPSKRHWGHVSNCVIPCISLCSRGRHLVWPEINERERHGSVAADARARWRDEGARV